jgi:flagellar protein FlgJ
MNETSFYSNQILWRANAVLNKTGIDRAQCEKTQTSTEKRPDISGENHQVAVEFEAIFLKELLKVMRQTVPKSGFLNGGWTEEFYWDMLNQELSECIAHAGGIGLAKMIYLDIRSH